MADPLLSVRNLKTYFYTYAGVVKALEGVNLDICKGESIGLVGETGCGKSVTALSILRLIDFPGKIVEGEVLFKGEDLLKKSEEEMREIRGRQIAIIFQDPMTYINPVYTIGEQMADVILRHQELREEVIDMKVEDLEKNTRKVFGVNTGDLKSKVEELKRLKENPPKPSKRDAKRAALRKAVDLLKIVKMPDPERVVSQYPHELSGGMRQRVMIAMALSCNPEVLIADEATTFLDVTVQAQIFSLLSEITAQTGTSTIIITHDLGVVSENCDKVAIMYAGNVVEYAETVALFDNPLHPYTVGLLNAIPKLHEDVEELDSIPGSIPDLIYPPSGCRFHPRCTYVKEVCRQEKPESIEAEPGHFVSCHLFDELKGVS
jgi:peptide/nickel transport system ATP-binding protein